MSRIRRQGVDYVSTLRPLTAPSRIRRATTRLAGFSLVFALVAAAVVVGGSRLLPDLHPFKTETKDRPQPALLQSLQRLDEYHAARANLQQVVDIERDTRHVPSFIKGERTVMVATGDVDATVDFRQLGAQSVQASWERREVIITLPSARVGRARLDLARTRVVEHDRGLIDRAGDALGGDSGNEQRALLLAAQRKLDAAARADKNLLPTAQRNTEQMLRNLALGLGYKKVTVRFAAPQI
jgi:hypothetical protein